MKKNVLRVLAGVMTVFMLFAMTACDTPKPEQQPEISVETEADSAVKAYVEANRSQVESLETNGIFDIKLEARGTKVVYKYTYNEIDNLSDDEIAAMKQALADEMDKNKETMDQTISTMKSEEPNVTAMVFEYYQKSGDLIASFEVN